MHRVNLFYLSTPPIAINNDNNQLEFSVPREMINFGSELGPWVYSVADFQWAYWSFSITFGRWSFNVEI